MLRTTIWLLAVAVLLPAPLQARERLLSPTDDWQLTRSAESCLLQRNFKDASGASLRLDIEAFHPGETYRFLLVGDALPLRDGLRRGVGVIKYRFKPDRGWREAGAVTGYVEGMDALSFQSNIATEAEMARRASLLEAGEAFALSYEPEAVRAAQVVQFALAYPSRDDTVLQLDSMSAPLAQVQSCAGQLMSDWGYDPAVLGRQRTAPVLQNAQDIGLQIQRAMRDASLGQNQPINFRLHIDRDGKVKGCAIQSPRRENAIEALVCDILTAQSVVIPARDVDGNPLAAPLFSRVAFAPR